MREHEPVVSRRNMLLSTGLGLALPQLAYGDEKDLKAALKKLFGDVGNARKNVDASREWMEKSPRGHALRHRKFETPLRAYTAYERERLLMTHRDEDPRSILDPKTIVLPEVACRWYKNPEPSGVLCIYVCGNLQKLGVSKKDRNREGKLHTGLLYSYAEACAAGHDAMIMCSGCEGFAHPKWSTGIVDIHNDNFVTAMGKDREYKVVHGGFYSFGGDKGVKWMEDAEDQEKKCRLEMLLPGTKIGEMTIVEPVFRGIEKLGITNRARHISERYAPNVIFTYQTRDHWGDIGIANLMGDPADGKFRSIRIHDVDHFGVDNKAVNEGYVPAGGVTRGHNPEWKLPEDNNE